MVGPARGAKELAVAAALEWLMYPIGLGELRPSHILS